MNEVDVYTRQLQAGTLSRRGFMNLVAGLGLGAAASGSIIESAFAATPKRGGHLRICFHNASQQETFDPVRRFSRLMAHRDRAVYNCLTDLTPKMEVIPGLAESWEANDSATEWTFHLRKGVEYHNGRSLHAKDVVYSINRIYNKEIARRRHGVRGARHRHHRRRSAHGALQAEHARRRPPLGAGAALVRDHPRRQHRRGDRHRRLQGGELRARGERQPRAQRELLEGRLSARRFGRELRHPGSDRAPQRHHRGRDGRGRPDDPHPHRQDQQHRRGRAALHAFRLPHRRSYPRRPRPP